MSKESARRQEIIDSAREMKALPETAARLSALCSSHIADAPGLYKLISLDPALFFQTQALFRYYYPREKDGFVSIAKIIITLNINTVKNNALRFAAPPNQEAQKNGASFFSHALTSALAARRVAMQRGVDEDSLERYYAAGLLHDIGKLLPGEIDDHCTAGALAAEAIGLSTDIQDAIRYHHSITKYRGNAADLVSVTALADFIAHSALSTGGGEPLRELDAAVWEKTGISGDLFAQIKEDLARDFAACEHFIRTGV